MTADPQTVEGYFDALPEATRTALQEVRSTLHDAIPGAQEKISYGIPTLTLRGRNVVSFAGWAKHLSIYPIPAASEGSELAQRLEAHRSGRGTLKFPLSEPVPLDLVRAVGVLFADQAAGTDPLS